ncbi:unnamed protein product, partial [Thlaspi arvense]
KAQSRRHVLSWIFVSLGSSISVDSRSWFSCFAHKGSVGDAVIVLSETEALFASFETGFLELESLLSLSDDDTLINSSDPAPPSSSLHEAHSLPDSDVSRRLLFLQLFALIHGRRNGRVLLAATVTFRVQGEKPFDVSEDSAYRRESWTLPRVTMPASFCQVAILKRWVQLSVVYSLGVEIFHTPSYLKHEINRDREGQSVLLPRTTYLFDVRPEGFTHQFHDQETLFLFLVRESAENPPVLSPSTLIPTAEIRGHQILSPELPGKHLRVVPLLHVLVRMHQPLLVHLFFIPPCDLTRHLNCLDDGRYTREQVMDVMLCAISTVL